MVLIDLRRRKSCSRSISDAESVTPSERLANSLGGPTGNGRLLDNDLGAGRDFSNSSGSQLDKVQVSGETSTETRLLGRSVDRDKDQVGLGDTLVDLGGEEQVPASASLDNINETGLVDGQVEVGVVPSVDTGLVEIDDSDLDVRALESAGHSKSRKTSCLARGGRNFPLPSTEKSLHNSAGGSTDVTEIGAQGNK